MWNLILVHLEIVFDRGTVCTKHTIGSEIVLERVLILMQDRCTVCVEAQVDACFCPFGDSANPDARQVHRLRRTYHMLGSQFGHTRYDS